MTKPGTQQLQRWMNEVITTQGNIPYKLQKAAHLHQLDIDDVVVDSRNVSVYSRMHVYTSGYVMRLFECMCADFPVLQKFMGNEVFDHFAKASLLWSPSTSYSLNDLGTTFIRFLQATRPTHIAADDEQSVFLDLPIEIARAERARSEALRAKGPEDFMAENIEIFPEEILFNAHQVTVSTPECLRLTELKFPVKQLFDGLYSEEPYEIPEPQPTLLAVSRMNYRLTVEELREWQCHFLKACHKPCSLTEAINETAITTQTPTSTIFAEMCIWLPIFQAKGFVIVGN